MCPVNSFRPSSCFPYASALPHEKSLHSHRSLQEVLLVNLSIPPVSIWEQKQHGWENTVKILLTTWLKKKKNHSVYFKLSKELETSPSFLTKLSKLPLLNKPVLLGTRIQVANKSFLFCFPAVCAPFFSFMMGKLCVRCVYVCVLVNWLYFLNFQSITFIRKQSSSCSKPT